MGPGNDVAAAIEAEKKEDQGSDKREGSEEVDAFDFCCVALFDRDLFQRQYRTLQDSFDLSLR